MKKAIIALHIRSLVKTKRAKTTTVLLAALTASSILLSTANNAEAQAGPDADDNLNATLWTQQSVEFKANAISAYKAAEAALDQALADKSWTAADEQSGDYQSLPPAVILDVDETVLDNMGYQAWTVISGEQYPENWNNFVNSATSEAIPGSLAFIKAAAAKGVRIFFVSNRTANLEEATRKNLKALGYPIDESIDTVLLKKEREDWGSKKGTRRAEVAKAHRVLMIVGDNLGDFVDGYKGAPHERAQIFNSNMARWGSKWIMITNPSYGSWEHTHFGFDYKLSPEEKRKLKRGSLEPWKP